MRLHALTLLSAALVCRSAAHLPEVLSTMGMRKGAIITEAVVLDTDHEMTLRHNMRTDALEDFKTGYIAMKNLRQDGVCAVEKMKEGRADQLLELRNTKAEANQLHRIRRKFRTAKPVKDVAALAGDRIAEFCNGLKVVQLVKNGNAAQTRGIPQRRGWIKRGWNWLKDNTQIQANIGRWSINYSG